MGLTDKQLRDFAEYLISDKHETPTVTANATVQSVDNSGIKPIYYVKFDGAEGLEPCPVSSTIAEGENTLQPDDRVVVLVKDREGTIVGNIDKPMSSFEYDDTDIKSEIGDARRMATDYIDTVTLASEEGIKINKANPLPSDGFAHISGSRLAFFENQSSTETDIYFGKNKVTKVYGLNATYGSFTGDGAGIFLRNQSSKTYVFEIREDGHFSIKVV